MTRCATAAWCFTERVSCRHIDEGDAGIIKGLTPFLGFLSIEHGSDPAELRVGQASDTSSRTRRDTYEVTSGI